MAIYNTPDGRQVVGSTVAGNDYHGFNGKRDIIIQLTEDGATTDGLNALEYLKAYAVEQNKQNKPIFPNGTMVFISANGYTKAVEADDIVIDGDNITIGGIEWNGEAWDFTNAGQSGGGSGGGVLVVTDTNGTLDKTWQEIHDAMLTGTVVIDRSNPLATDISYVGHVTFTSFGGDRYSVYTEGDAHRYDTSSASGYPVLQS